MPSMIKWWQIPEIESTTFDIEKTLPCPNLSTNVAYYKRQLNIYSMAIHVGSNDKGNFIVWLENEAGKGIRNLS